MKSKKILPKYSAEVRERAVRMVQEHRGEYPWLWAEIESIAPNIGCVPQTLHDWVRKHEPNRPSQRPVLKPNGLHETRGGSVCPRQIWCAAWLK
jgi:transposase-like protein